MKDESTGPKVGDTISIGEPVKFAVDNPVQPTVPPVISEHALRVEALRAAVAMWSSLLRTDPEAIRKDRVARGVGNPVLNTADDYFAWLKGE